MQFREGYRGSNSFLMEAATENMQSRNSDATMYLLMHYAHGRRQPGATEKP